MAKKSTITKDELADLKARGYVEGRADTIPENLSPVLKSRLLAEISGDEAKDAVKE